MATNTVKVELVGHDKSLSKTLRKGSIDATTFSGKLKLLGRAFSQLIHGNIKGMGRSLNQLAGGFSKFGMIAGAAIAGAVAAFYVLQRVLRSVMKTYSDYMVSILKTQRVTGMTTKATSLLLGQMRLSGVEMGKVSTGLALFSKNLDAARQGTGTVGDAFDRLNVSLRDAQGNVRSADAVLMDVRDRLSKVDDASTRAGLAAKLFGRGYKDMLPWLTASSAKMQEYAKYLRAVGMIMTDQSMKAFKEYREAQRKMGIAWDSLKIAAGAAFAPLITVLMNKLRPLMEKAAGWVDRFRRLVEKKGWETALKKMVPWVLDIRDGLLAAYNNVSSFGSYVKRNWKAITDAFEGILDPVRAIRDALSSAYGFLLDINRATGGGGGGSGKGAFEGILDPLRWIGGLFGAEGGVFNKPTAKVIGEAGPEAVIPLTNPQRAAEVMAQAGLGGGPATVNVYLDGKLIESHVTKRQGQRARRNARTWGYAPA